jgi:hypothetical protein
MATDSTSDAKFFQDEMFPKSELTKMSIQEFETRLDSLDMIVPDFQRDFVWNKKDQQGYLLSLSKGYPLFGPVINVDADTGILTIVDGQNRLLTIYNYLKDKTSFEDEDGASHKFSELSDNRKRTFRNTKISYLETYAWSKKDCQEFFVAMNGGGVKLKSGELIHADQDNILTGAITGLAWEYKESLESKALDGGYQLTKVCLDRYGHYEILGTIFHMVRTNEFPLRPGRTALDELKTWRNKGENDIFRDTYLRVIVILNQHKELMDNVPRLRQKVTVADHLRLMFFLLKTELYHDTLDESHYTRFEALLNRVLNKDNPAYDQIVKWGTGDCMEIYGLYHSIYYTYN